MRSIEFYYIVFVLLFQSFNTMIFSTIIDLLSIYFMIYHDCGNLSFPSVLDTYNNFLNSVKLVTLIPNFDQAVFNSLMDGILLQSTV